LASSANQLIARIEIERGIRPAAGENFLPDLTLVS
jgi:hypothetical protein